MSILKIKSSKSAIGNLRYILDGEAHNNKLTSHRFIDAEGQNVKRDYGGEFDPMYIAYQFKTSRNHAKNPDKKIQSEHLITSFSSDEFDCSDLKNQSKQALELVNGALKKRVPPDSQFISVVQVDGEGSKLHVHTILNSVRKNGRVVNTNLLSVTGKDNIRDAFDNSFQADFKRITGRDFTPVNPNPNRQDLQTPNEYYQNKRGSYIWRDDLKNKISQALMAVTSGSIDDFKDNLKALNVDVDERQVGIGKNADGTKQKRSAFTYSFIDEKGKSRKSKDFVINKSGRVRGLGQDFTPQSIQNDLNELKKRAELDAEEDQNEMTFESHIETIKVKDEGVLEHEHTKKRKSEEHENSTEESDERPIIEPIQFDEFDTSESTKRIINQRLRDEAEDRERNQAKSATAQRRRSAGRKLNIDLSGFDEPKRPESGQQRRSTDEAKPHPRPDEPKPGSDNGLEL